MQVRQRQRVSVILATTVSLMLVSVTHAITVPGPGGAAAQSDGALTFSPDGGSGNNMTIDLAQAASGVGIQWDTASPIPGRGVYDPEKWAVVFKYSSVNIPAGKTLLFKNHPSYAPVVWLVTGDVTIAGTVNLSGSSHTGSLFIEAEPGPGGFRGARGQTQGIEGSGGHGPGGANYLASGNARGSGGSYGEAALGALSGPKYGNSMILPLIGGSGGGASRNDYSAGGGAGGGAITIVAANLITVTGSILANGGPAIYGGGGSGGAVRLIAERIQGTALASVQATGGAGTGSGATPGSAGRIRFEANEFSTPLLQGSPQSSNATPGNPVLLWPPAEAPTLQIVQITPAGGSAINAPADPRPGGGLPDVVLNTSQPVLISIAATNVPLDWPVIVRVVPHGGGSFSVAANPLQGTQASSATTAQLTLPPGTCSIQLRAAHP